MVKGQLTTMAESFINQVKRTSSIKTYEYEDFLIKGEVKNAKNMITKAIKVQKSHITWCYAHDDYDNFTSLRNDIDEPYPYTKNYKNDKSHIRIGGYCDLDFEMATILADGDMKNSPKVPEISQHVDFKYIEKNLEKELYHLGCKSVSLYIGPKTIKERRPKKKGIFNDTYEEVSLTVLKWMVSLSW